MSDAQETIASLEARLRALVEHYAGVPLGQSQESNGHALTFDFSLPDQPVS